MGGFTNSLYQRYWRFAGVDDLFLLSRLHLLAGTLLVILFTLLAGKQGPLCQALPVTCGGPRTVPRSDLVLAFAAMAGLRYGARFLNQQQRRR